MIVGEDGIGLVESVAGLPCEARAEGAAKATKLEAGAGAEAIGVADNQLKLIPDVYVGGSSQPSGEQGGLLSLALLQYLTGRELP